MPKSNVNYFMLCENLIADNMGRISLINLFDILNSPGETARANKFTFAISVKFTKSDLTDGKVQMGVELIDPEGRTFFKAESEINPPEDQLGANIVAPLDLSGQLEFKISGKYTAKLLIAGKEQAEVGFQVNLNQKDT